MRFNFFSLSRLTFYLVRKSVENKLSFRLLVLMYFLNCLGLDESRSYCSSPKRLLGKGRNSDLTILVVCWSQSQNSLQCNNSRTHVMFVESFDIIQI